MDRLRHALGVLQFDLANGYELRQVDDPAWLECHGGGFSPISTETMTTYEVNPARVVEMGAHLSDEGFTAFVEAIRCWQKSTLTDYLFGVPADLVVTKFCQDHRDEGLLLLAVAAHHEMDPVRFFGAQHHDR